MVESTPNGATALNLVKSMQPEAVIIDAASMRTSGSRICTSMRRAVGSTPIILIIAENEENVYHPHADEVLQLPFTCQKLLNRLRPFIAMEKNKILELGPIRLDLKERWVHCEDKRERLTPRLFVLLEKMMRHPGEMLIREDLFREIWETDYLGDMRSLDVHISWLRQAIEENPRSPKYIKTERGIGYRLEVEKPKRPLRSGR